MTQASARLVFTAGQAKGWAAIVDKYEAAFVKGRRNGLSPRVPPTAE